MESESSLLVENNLNLVSVPGQKLQFATSCPILRPNILLLLLLLIIIIIIMDHRRKKLKFGKLFPETIGHITASQEQVFSIKIIVRNMF
jgi:hypothetical protein